MNKPALLLCTAFISFISLNSQGLYKVSIEEKIRNASVIIEGKVVSKQSFWNASQTMIYTSNKVEIYKIFKGSTSSDTIEVITEGGSVGTKAITVTHLLKLNVNDFGVFFCSPGFSGLNRQRTKSILYDVYASQQGFIKYDPIFQKASTPFARYENTDQLYSEIRAKTGIEVKSLRAFPLTSRQKLSQTMSLGISGFSPTTVNAGTLLDPATNILTITGSGFGTASGSAAVLFDNPDDGSGGTLLTPVPYNSPLIISWSSNSIQVRVPADAGTGYITVRDDLGNLVTSSSMLNVNYSVQALTFVDPVTSIAYVKESNLFNSNGLGGYTIRYSISTAGSGINITTSPALATFRRALTTWKEMAGFNVVEGSNTNTQAITYDGINAVMFDNSNTGKAPLAAGVLAVCYSYYGLCNDFANDAAVKLEFDIVIRNSGFSSGSTTFTYGPCPPNTNDYSQIDLETVILHELGHAIGLGHINDDVQFMSPTIGQINPGKLMNYAVTNSVKRTTPDYSAKSGANYLINPQGNSYGSCGITEMTPLSIVSEPKDDCPSSFPSTTIAQGTLVNFDLAHAGSNKHIDPAFSQFRCNGQGGAQTNNAYYAFTTNNNNGALQLSVSGYTTAPGSLTGCTEAYPGIPVTGIRLALYQVNSCPSAGSYPAPIACATITGNGTLSPIPGLSANTKYLMYVEGIDNTKANFTVQFGGTILPVKITSFTGNTLNAYNELEWKAEAPTNVEKIVIQKSQNGINYKSLGETKSFNELLNGKMRDASPYQKTYYRLAINNTDRSIEYSNVVILERTQKTYITVYPNPASKLISIQINSLDEGRYVLKLYNTLGQMVRQKTAEFRGQTIQIPVDKLSQGSYRLELLKNDVRLLSNTIIVSY